MPNIAIRAEYAPLINLFRSNEETRYYLNGFLVEPAPAHCGGGVRLVATDGHRMGVFSDAFGQADGPSIWNLDAATLKACKPARSDYDQVRWLVIEEGTKGDTFGPHNATVVLVAPVDHGKKTKPATASDAIAASRQANDMVLSRAWIKPIDGTFPDYGRVVPPFPDQAKAKFTPHNGAYLVDFAKVAATREGDTGKHAATMTICSEEYNAPSLILTERTDFIGVLMPIRGSNAARHELPEWWTATPGVPVAAAAE